MWPSIITNTSQVKVFLFLYFSCTVILQFLMTRGCDLTWAEVYRWYISYLSNLMKKVDNLFSQQNTVV